MRWPGFVVSVSMMLISTSLFAGAEPVPAGKVVVKDFCKVAADYHELAAIYKIKGYPEEEAMTFIRESVTKVVDDKRALDLIENAMQVAVERVYERSWYDVQSHRDLGYTLCEKSPNDYMKIQPDK